MKEKIIAAIKAKFPAINLSKKRLDAIAAKIEAKVIDDETKIDAAIDAFNDYNPLVDMAKTDDQLRDQAIKLKLAATPPKKDETPPKTDETPVDDGTPAWAKALIEQNKTLSADLAAIKGEKTQSTIRAKATEKLKDIPASYWGKRPLPEKDEDFEGFVTEVQADYAAFKKEMTDQGLSVLPSPRAGEQQAGPSKGINPEVKAHMEAKKAQPAAAQAAPGTQSGFINTPKPL